MNRCPFCGLLFTDEHHCALGGSFDPPGLNYVTLDKPNSVCVQCGNTHPAIWGRCRRAPKPVRVDIPGRVQPEAG